jgi:hypothetical protein
MDLAAAGAERAHAPSAVEDGALGGVVGAVEVEDLGRPAPSMKSCVYSPWAPWPATSSRDQVRPVIARAWRSAGRCCPSRSSSWRACRRCRRARRSRRHQRGPSTSKLV